MSAGDAGAYFEVVWIGRLLTVLGIIWSAPLLTRVGLLVGILGLLAAILVRADVPAELGDAFDRAARSTALRGGSSPAGFRSWRWR